MLPVASACPSRPHKQQKTSALTFEFESLDAAAADLLSPADAAEDAEDEEEDDDAAAARERVCACSGVCVCESADEGWLLRGCQTSSSPSASALLLPRAERVTRLLSLPSLPSLLSLLSAAAEAAEARGARVRGGCTGVGATGLSTNSG